MDVLARLAQSLGGQASGNTTDGKSDGGPASKLQLPRSPLAKRRNPGPANKLNAAAAFRDNWFAIRVSKTPCSLQRCQSY